MKGESLISGKHQSLRREAISRTGMIILGKERISPRNPGCEVPSHAFGEDIYWADNGVGLN